MGEVVLFWAAPLRFYEVSRHEYRYKTDGAYGNWQEIPDSGQAPDSLTAAHRSGYAVTGLTGGQTHTFEVRAVNVVSGTPTASDPSNEAMATPRTAALEVSFGESAYSVDEGGTVEVTVRLGGGVPGRQVTVPLSAEGAGGATAADWSGVPESVTFGALQTSHTFTLTATDDTDADAGESVELGFGTPLDGVTAGTPSAATVTIVDDDDASLPALSVGDAEAAEGDGVEFTVTLSAAAAADVTATWTASLATDDTAETGDFIDLSAATGTLTITASQTTATVTVATKEDTTDEEDETFTVTLSSPSSNAELGTSASAKGTIRDDDDPPKISVQDQRVNEGNQDPDDLVSSGYPLRVALSQASEKRVRFQVRRVELATDTATEADLQDTTLYQGFDVINAGATFDDLRANNIVNDTLDEPDETFTLEIHAFENATAGAKTQATITIEDDDDPPTLSVDDASATEGDAVEFTVEMAESGKQVTVAWAASAGTGDSATADTDFTAASGTLTFSPGTPGDTAKTVTVATAGDTTAEEAETFTLTLSSPTNAGFAGDATEVTATGTIEDSMLPVLSVGNASATEGSAVAFKVKLSVASEEQVTVDWAASAESGDTAVAGTDFTAVAATSLTFTAGDTEQTVTVATALDALDEEDETFTVRLSNPTNATLASNPTAKGTIDDDDDPPVLSVEAATALEGEDVEFTVKLSPASGREVTVDWEAYAETGDTATSGTDFTAVDIRTLIFTAGETAKTLTVSTTEDTTDEEDETFTLALSGVDNAGFAGGVSQVTARGTITDDDREPTLSVADAEATEGDVVEFVVTLSAVSGRDVTVDYATSVAAGDDAVSGTDFTAKNGTLTIAAADNTATGTIEVQTTEDDASESAETFTLTLSSPANATLGTDTTATGTITDDDAAALPELSVADAEAAEGDGVAFTVTLSATAAADVTATWTASLATDDTAEQGDFTDLSAATGTLTITASETTATVTVATKEDTTDEDDETFTVTLSSPSSNARIADATARGTIEDDDDPPKISTADLRQSEATLLTRLTVNLSAASEKLVRFRVRRVQGATDTATDADLVDIAEATNYSMAAGNTSFTVANRAYVQNDTLDEDDETFTLEIHTFENATAGAKTQATITIEDDDPEPTLSVEPASATEGDAVEFTVTLDAESGKQVTVAWAASAGTGDSATAGTDFTAAAGTLTFSPGTPGDTAKTVTVATHGDTTVEEAETFTLTLSSPANAGFAGGATEVTATGTIEDSMLPVLSVGDASATEGSAVALKVKLSVASEEQVTVDWAAAKESGDPADAGTDFTAVAATSLTFTAGDTEQTVTVATALDALDEEDETFTVRLSNPTNATLASNPTAKGTIDDDDDPPVLSVEAASALEGEDVEFTVTLDPASGREVTVGWEAYAETGDTAGTGDFTEVDTSLLIFTAGQTAKTLTVSTIEDTTDEEDETFTLTLSGVDNAGFAAGVSQVTAQGTIEDDDPEPTLSVDDSSAAEGDGVEFTVKLSPASGKQVTVAWATSVATGDTAVSGTDFTAANGTLTFAAATSRRG